MCETGWTTAKGQLARLRRQIEAGVESGLGRAGRPKPEAVGRAGGLVRPPPHIALTQPPTPLLTAHRFALPRLNEIRISTMPTLDHLILLVPSLDPAALAAFSSAGLTLLPGGTHADGVTGNVLIPLPDGVYIELIAFLAGDPAKRAGHWWGNKQDGWIDWSLAPAPSTSDEVLAEIETRAGVQPYDAPVSGGRLTTEGKKLEWKVTFPKLEARQKRGVRPFWCEDVSPREWRVSRPVALCMRNPSLHLC